MAWSAQLAFLDLRDRVMLPVTIEAVLSIFSRPDFFFLPARIHRASEME